MWHQDLILFMYECLQINKKKLNLSLKSDHYKSQDINHFGKEGGKKGGRKMRRAVNGIGQMETSEVSKFYFMICMVIKKSIHLIIIYKLYIYFMWFF